jgi:amidase
MSRGRHWNRDVAIGWCAGDGTTPVDDETSGLMETVAAHMGRDGYTVVHRPAALSGGHGCYNDLRDYDPLLNARALVAGKEDMIGDELRQALDRSSGPHPQPEAAVRERALLWRQEFISGLEETPVLLAPVAPTPAVGHDGRAVVSARELAKWELMAFCRAVSLTAAPVVTVPCCRSTAGLPMAVQVVGPPFGERMVLEVARYLEDAFGGFSPPPGVD